MLPSMEQPLISQSVGRVRAWLAAHAISDNARRQIADEAQVDEKTIRHALNTDWNPTRKTLEKLEALIPPNFKRKRRAA